MREIKFRKWDKNHEAMEYDFGYYNGDVDINSEIRLEMEHGVIMQYTGLKDKNGKEIYEGDIINYKPNARKKTDYHVVTWNKEGFWDMGDWYENAYPLNFILVGNIYENPNLLNDKQND